MSSSSGAAAGYHRDEEVTKVLLFRRQARVGLDTNEEAALKVGERVEVEKQVVDLVLGNDTARGDLTLVVLRARARGGG